VTDKTYVNDRQRVKAKNLPASTSTQNLKYSIVSQIKCQVFGKKVIAQSLYGSCGSGSSYLFRVLLSKQIADVVKEP